MSASPSLLFYHAFLLFYLSIFVCILCRPTYICIGCHFGVINDETMMITSFDILYQNERNIIYSQ